MENFFSKYIKVCHLGNFRATDNCIHDVLGPFSKKLFWMFWLIKQCSVRKYKIAFVDILDTKALAIYEYSRY